MPSEREATCFADIVAAAYLIGKWLEEAGGADPALHANVLVRSAIERQLLIISEAAIRLHKLDPELAEKIAPAVDWAGIRGIGNFIRHKYDDLDTRVIADVLKNRLLSLRMAAENALTNLSSK